MKKVECPACGASNEVNNPGVNMITCENCHTILYWDEFSFVQNGPKVNPDEPEPFFAVGDTGTIGDSTFEVLGWMRFSYSGGYYEECFIHIGTGDDYAILMNSAKWPMLASSKHSFFLCPIIKDSDDLLGWQHPALGSTITLGEESFNILEADKAKCIAIKGELPWPILPGEYVNYYVAASADDRHLAQIVYDLRNKPYLLIYENTLYNFDDDDDDDSETADQANASLPQVSVCAACGAVLSKTLPPQTVMVGCPSCGMLNDLAHIEQTSSQEASENTLSPSGDTARKEAQIIGKAHSISSEAAFDYDLGQTFNYAGHKCRISGAIFSCINALHSQLYLIPKADGQYFYLEKSAAGSFLLTKARNLPEGSVQQWNRLQPGDNLAVAGTSYEILQVNRTTITALAGSFPYIATVGDDIIAITAIKGKEVYKIERTHTSILFYEGQTLSAEEEERCLGRKSRSAFYHRHQVAQKPQNQLTSPTISSSQETAQAADINPDILKKPKKKSSGCGCGCLIFLILATIFGLSVADEIDSDQDFGEVIKNGLKAFFDDARTARTDAVLALDAFDLSQKEYNEKYKNKWQEILDTRYLEPQELKTPAKFIAIADLHFKTTASKASELRELLKASNDDLDTERVTELAEIINKNVDSYKAVETNLEKELPPLFEERAKAIKTVGLLDTGYKQFKAWQQQDPTQDFQKDVDRTLGFWPPQKDRLLKIKTERDQKKKAMLQTFKNMQDMQLNDKTITRAKYAKYQELQKTLGARIETFNEANKKLSSSLSELYETHETILTDIYLDTSEQKEKPEAAGKPYVAEFKKIIYLLSGGKPAFTVERDIKERLSKEEFKELSPYLGMTIKIKKQGQFTDESLTIYLAAGYLILPAVGTSDQVGSWQGENFVFAQEAGNLGNELWNNCVPPPYKAMADRKLSASDLQKLVGSGSSWNRVCYRKARYYQNR